MLTKIKVYACYTVKIHKNKPQFFFSNRGARPVRWSWIRLLFQILRKKQFSCKYPSILNCIQMQCINSFLNIQARKLKTRHFSYRSDRLVQFMHTCITRDNLNSRFLAAHRQNQQHDWAFDQDCPVVLSLILVYLRKTH